MGIANCAELLWNAKNLELKDIYILFEHMFPERRGKAPRLDIDVFNVCRTLYSTTNKRYGEMLVDFTDLCDALAHKGGFFVTLVLDGTHRHHAKRSAWDRKAKKEFALIDSFYDRQLAMIIGSKIDSGRATDEDRNTMTTLTKEARILENRTFEAMDFPETFKEDLYKRLVSNGSFNTNDNNSGLVNEDIIENKFQADSVIAYRALNNLSDAHWSTDSDYVSMIGSNTINVTDIKIKNKTKKKDAIIESFRIIGGCNEQYGKIKNNVLKSDTIIWSEAADHPLLSTDNYLIRALVSVVLGNDYMLGNGILGIGVVGMSRLVKKMEEVTGNTVRQYNVTDTNIIDMLQYRTLRQYICEESGISSDDLVTLVMAQIAEPYIDKKENYNYMYGVPPVLPEYLKEYKKSDTANIPEIIPGSKLCNCCGIKGKAHPFLESEGAFKCVSCDSTYCASCGYVPSSTDNSICHREKKENLCYGCYRKVTIESFGKTSDTLLTTKDMIDELRKINGSVQIDNNADPHEIEELYDAMVALDDASPHNRLSKEVCFPCLPPTSLDNMEPFLEADLIKGATFVGDKERLTDTRLLSLLQTFSSLVTFTDKKYTSWDADIYKSLPGLFKDFANGSRVDSGYRLLERCLRHATDPRSSPLIKTSIKLVADQTTTQNEGLVNDHGGCCVILENKVPASMRQSIYNVKVAFSHNKLVACSCTCKAGGESEMKDEGVVCVHTLPVIYQLYLLLIEGLAQHFLIELSNRWNDSLDTLVGRLYNGT